MIYLRYTKKQQWENPGMFPDSIGGWDWDQCHDYVYIQRKEWKDKKNFGNEMA